ncbi:MAG: penicillin-binding protein 2 [Candidatus Atribacteria bacterium]|nr:penicillin-binding protein 2 [Candidatus Atribacteria bacterium]
MFSQKNEKVSREFIQTRLSNLFMLMIIFFILLLINLWYLQIIRGKEYELRAMNNCIRSLVEEAPRGEIYDQKGKLMVTNRPAVNLSVVPAEADDDQTLSSKLSPLISIEEPQIVEKLTQMKQNPFQAQTLKRDLNTDQVIAIEEQKYKLKGILLEVQPERKYLYQDLAAHVLGYVNEISMEELNSSTWENVSGGDIVGKNGIEKHYDAYLRGEKGSKEVEVDALGREIATLIHQEPVAGNDLYLTIDSELQQFSQDILVEHRGTVIVSEPHTGRILAMVSQPGYDPNLFTQEISVEAWNEIAQSKENLLCNRNIQGIYPPGSVFKLITAIAAIEEGIVDLNSTVYCPGYFELGDLTFKCWKETGHGNQNIIGAIRNSCNVFFYTMGQRLGIDRLSHYAQMFGLGEITDIDLPGELTGLVPSQEWKNKALDQVWYPGDTINLSIGQGYLLATPFQIHRMVCAIASEGKVYKPFHVEKIISPNGEIVSQFEPELVKEIGLSQKTFQIVKEGMREVVLKGTGIQASVEGLEVAGKTGTAQNPQGENHAWFVGFAPYADPEICITVFVEHGGDGSQAAAPIASKIIQKYFQLKYRNDEKEDMISK